MSDLKRTVERLTQIQEAGCPFKGDEDVLTTTEMSLGISHPGILLYSGSGGGERFHHARVIAALA